MVDSAEKGTTKTEGDGGKSAALESVIYETHSTRYNADTLATGKRESIEAGKELMSQGILPTVHTHDELQSPDHKPSTGERSGDLSAYNRSKIPDLSEHQFDSDKYVDPNKDSPNQKDPFEEWQKNLQEAKEKERAENIGKIVESIGKDGKLPEDISMMLRDFAPMLFAGRHGDQAGLSTFLDDINKRLKESGSQYSLSMVSFEREADRKSGGIFSSWTDNIISVKNAQGVVTDKTNLVTDPIAKPGIKF